jgi:hypothetical protein
MFAAAMRGSRFSGKNIGKFFDTTSNPMTAKPATIDMFSDKVGQVFVVDEPDFAAIELMLAEVAPLRNYANAVRAPFSLLFTSRGSAVLPQRMYALRHAALGLQSVFLVPIAGNSGSVTYQAIFN